MSEEVDRAGGSGGYATTTRRAAVSIIDRLVVLAHDRLPDDPVLAEFITRYYRELPGADLDDRQLDDLYAAAVVHLSLGRERLWGETRVKVLSPDRDLDGWHSSRSVLLLVTDDAPFLVDTVRMVLDRRDIRTHLLVHPMLDVRRDDRGVLLGCDADGDRTEAWTQIEIDRCDPESGAP
ncbi:MAG: hypothetical protein WD225_01185, partial [Ilumatobacteraceae bacterium]